MLRHAVQNIDVRLFADDTFIHDSNCDNLIRRAKQCLLQMKTWFDKNKLTIHLGKTNFTMFHGNKKNYKCYDHFDVGVHRITRTSSTRYLGLTIDENLSWKNHITDLCQCLLKYTGIFYRIRSKLPHNTALQLYYAVVYSRISYCIEVYGTAICSILKPGDDQNICQFQIVKKN
jgi:hypothetical protein